MAVSYFQIFNGSFSSSLSKARRAAYLFAMRSSGRGDEVSNFHSSNWEAPLNEAESELAKKLLIYTNVPKDIIEALWMHWGLTEVYVHQMAETAGIPVEWDKWLLSSEGINLQKRFPQDGYNELLKQLGDSLNNHKSARKKYYDRKSPAKTLPPSRFIFSTVVHGTEISPQKSSGQESSVPELQHDMALVTVRSIQSQFGTETEDNRQTGGALWIKHLQNDDAIANQLRQANFRFHPVRGWWFK